MLKLTEIRGRVAAWAKYRRTVAAIEGLPLEVALDLDLYPGDARRIARRVVYGH